MSLMFTMCILSCVCRASFFVCFLPALRVSFSSLYFSASFIFSEPNFLRASSAHRGQRFQQVVNRRVPERFNGVCIRCSNKDDFKFISFQNIEQVKAAAILHLYIQKQNIGLHRFKTGAFHHTAGFGNHFHFRCIGLQVFSAWCAPAPCRQLLWLLSFVLRYQVDGKSARAVDCFG